MICEVRFNSSRVVQCVAINSFKGMDGILVATYLRNCLRVNKKHIRHIETCRNNKQFYKRKCLSSEWPAIRYNV